MLDAQTKRRIDAARDVLVGKIPDPKAQVDQITTALIYKFMFDMDESARDLGGRAKYFTGEFKKYAWPELLSSRLSGHDRLSLYQSALNSLPQHKALPEIFRTVFKNAYLPYRDAQTLNLFLQEINYFTYDNSENLGNAFEYLLSVLGSQGDAGQFRTPRHIIDFIVEVLNPQKGDRILDPACGTAGFLISAYKHIIKQNSRAYKAPDGARDTGAASSDYSFVRPVQDASQIQIQSNGRYKGEKLKPQERKQLSQHIVGYDISPEMVKLSQVNMYLHSLKNPQIFEYDTLTSDHRWGQEADVILANPPFMSPKGGIRPHDKFSIRANRSEVLFVDYIAEHLSLRGRAGVIVPEGIIFREQRAYKSLRQMLIDDGYLWAVMSLPSGVFKPYSGVGTSVLFLDKQLAKKQDSILFIDIKNDGFELGDTRRHIDKNDLPQAFQTLTDWQQACQQGACVEDETQKRSSDQASHRSSSQLASGQILSKSYSVASSGSSSAKKTSAKVNSAKLSRRSKRHVESNLQHLGASKQADSIDMDQPELQKHSASDLQIQTSIELPELAHKVKKSAISQNNYNLNGQQYKMTAPTSTKWPVVKLGDVCELKNGYAFSSKEFTRSNGSGIPVVRISNLKNEIVEVASAVKIKSERSFVDFKIKKGDLLIAMSGATTGKMSIYTSDDPAYLNQRVGNLKITQADKISRSYRNHVLKHLSRTILIKSEGAAQPNISPKQIHALLIPLPPLEVQKQIVAEIESYQKIIDGAQQVVDNWKPTLNIDPTLPNPSKDDVLAMKNTAIANRKNKNKINVTKQFMQDKSTPDISALPPGWRMVKLGDVAKVDWGNTSLTKASYVTDGKYLAVSASGGDGRLNKFEHDIGAIVLSAIGANCGRFFWPKEKFTAIKNTIVLSANKNRMSPKYLYYLMIQGSLPRRGSSQPFISKGDVEKFSMRLPPLEVQKQMVEKIESEKKDVEACKNLIKIYKDKIKTKIKEVWSSGKK